jgi:prevent-host-death family protein
MERTITQRELRNDNAEIMRALESGDTFIITRNGVPVGRLSPVPRRTFVPTEELKKAFARLPRRIRTLARRRGQIYRPGSDAACLTAPALY